MEKDKHGMTKSDKFTIALILAFMIAIALIIGALGPAESMVLPHDNYSAATEQEPAPSCPEGWSPLPGGCYIMTGPHRMAIATRRALLTDKHKVWKSGEKPEKFVLDITVDLRGKLDKVFQISDINIGYRAISINFFILDDPKDALSDIFKVFKILERPGPEE